LWGANKCESVRQVYVMHMTGDDTQENKQRTGSNTIPVWPVLTTDLTILTSCRHTGLTGVGSQFDRYADLVSNNTSINQYIFTQIITILENRL
jgi:hypothetical protein